MEIQSGSLRIVSLGPSTSGRYQCVANSSVGAVVSRPATVSMGSKFIFLSVPSSLPIIWTSARLYGLFVFDFYKTPNFKVFEVFFPEPGLSM